MINLKLENNAVFCHTITLPQKLVEPPRKPFRFSAIPEDVVIDLTDQVAVCITEDAPILARLEHQMTLPCRISNFLERMTFVIRFVEFVNEMFVLDDELNEVDRLGSLVRDDKTGRTLVTDKPCPCFHPRRLRTARLFFVYGSRHTLNPGSTAGIGVVSSGIPGSTM